MGSDENPLIGLFVRMNRSLVAHRIAMRVMVAVPKVDLHGMTVPEAELTIDRLSRREDIVEVVTGHGKGVLKKLLKDLSEVYGYKILNTHPNNASFIVDFT
jgi:hypothetical protein